MKINKEIVEQIANLAQIELSDKEKNIYIKELKDVIFFMDKLNKVDTSEVKPMLHIQNLNNIFRKDIINKSLSQKEALFNTKEFIDNYFLVKKIL